MSLLVVIPCYNEENYIQKIHNDIQALNVPLDILFVDDGSNDSSLNIIKALNKKNSNVKYVSFSQHFGKEAGIFCGIDISKNLNYDFTVFVDSDGQDKITLLPEMFNFLLNNENYDAIACIRTNRRGESIFRQIASNLFYKILNKFTNSNIPDGARDYIMFRKNFRDALFMHKEKCRFFKGLYTSIGFNIKWIKYENIEVKNRKSKWSFCDLFAYAIEAVISSSENLLSVTAICGIVLFVISIIALLFVFFRTLFFGDPVAGWTSTICILLLLFGLQFIFIGVIGLYISKIYKEIKNRPIYIAKEISL